MGLYGSGCRPICAYLLSPLQRVEAPIWTRGDDQIGRFVDAGTIRDLPVGSVGTVEGFDEIEQ